MLCFVRKNSLKLYEYILSLDQVSFAGNKSACQSHKLPESGRMWWWQGRSATVPWTRGPSMGPMCCCCPLSTTQAAWHAARTHGLRCSATCQPSKPVQHPRYPASSSLQFLPQQPPFVFLCAPYPCHSPRPPCPPLTPAAPPRPPRRYPPMWTTLPFMQLPTLGPSGWGPLQLEGLGLDLVL